MDYYKCENCGKVFDEFEMNYFAAQKDKKCLCRSCREASQPMAHPAISPVLNYTYTKGVGHYKDCCVCVGECICG